MNNLIEETLENFWNDVDECYNPYYYDEEENEFEICNEVEKLFKAKTIKYKLSYCECYESAGYDCDMLSISWIEDDGELYLKNVIIEQY